MYNRIYHLTECELFKESSLYWYKVTLDMGNKEAGLAGYNFVWGDGWSTSPGIVMGISGIGLGLLAGISNNEPTWDEILLLS